ncbi:hypothetical protein [Blastococcus sp. Marseille-P5729]|uniref:hypothetical protein n=1 Tax=Blastococcus sp. Marseille-P5729 TaxID=2086582 RepID=UPI000D111582|nr:hypothetical protein [Blastococcus sp. Marseille-P5729]
MDFESAFKEAVQAAVTPSEADILVARGVVLDAMDTATEPVVSTEFVDRWLEAIGSQRPAPRTRFTAAPATEKGRRLADPDPMDPHMAEVRGGHAVRWAVSQLVAEGVLTQGPGNNYAIQPERISVDYPGGSSGVPVLVHSPLVGNPREYQRFMPARREPAGSEVLLPVDELLAGLDEILGSRGATMVRESRRALQRGLHLASSSLLAAASEAAWFNLARAVPDAPRALEKKVGEGRDAAEVIRLTEQKLRELKPSPGSATITEVVTQAHMYREVRNYALHPVEEHDGDRETWLTETGATLLAIAARRYFVKMAELQRRFLEDGQSK